MVSDLLILSGIFGFTGTMYKIVATTQSALAAQHDKGTWKSRTFHRHYTDMMIDTTSFALIGTGFLLAILGEAFPNGFKNSNSEILVGVILNFDIVGYGIALGFVDDHARTGITYKSGKGSLGFEALLFGILLILPILYSLFVRGTAYTFAAYAYSSILIIPVGVMLYNITALWKIRSKIEKELKS